MKALIFGINGQDGSFLAEYLLEKGYEVHGVIRRSSTNNLQRLNNIRTNKNLILHYGDLSDSISIFNIIKKVMPEEIYNLAAQSDVKVSFEIPEYTTDVNALGILRILDAVRILNMEKKARIYHSSTSELYGNNGYEKQDENTPFIPDSPYACAKMYAYNICKIYKEAYGMYICNGILFNHESERRGEEFVTRKITLAAARISLGLQDKLYLGNIYSKRDWGYAKDYVKMMHAMLQLDNCDDFVLATGNQYTVKYFCELVFKKLGINLIWIGKGLEEKGINAENNQVIIEIKKELYRPIDVNSLLGNPKKAMEKLNFNPLLTSIDELASIMIENDLKVVKNEIR